MKENRPLILASASPRRADLLQQIGVRFKACPVPVDETPLEGEEPQDYVLRLAEEKVAACLRTFKNSCGKVVILGSDTTVVYRGVVVGKPRDQQHFTDVFMQLSANTHHVLTAVALTDGKRVLTRITDTRVSFRQIAESEMEQYWLTGEPRDKAGGYAIQGRGAVFISSIEGSYSGVVGLPLMETAELLMAFGVPVWGG